VVRLRTILRETNRGVRRKSKQTDERQLS
jgi:hypothetical protein